MKNLHKFNKFSNFKRYFGSSKILNEKLTTEQVIQREKKYAAHTYHSLEVVWSRASGVTVWDPEGRKYLDFLASYSASNQGHCHPRLVKAMTTQANILDLSSRAFYSEKFGEYAEFVTKYFGYGAVLPMNSGAEGVEGAMKLARKWGYVKKKIPENQGEIITFTENFHGRTITIVSMSTDPEAYTNFGPRTSGFVTLPYDDVSALEDYLNKNGSRVSAVLIEPIQGEAGIKIPQQGYLKSVSSLCKKHNVLFMADEIQSGLGRAGKLLAVDYEEVRPDVLILGKALSGGMFPVSAILADWPIMESIRPGQHGSTYGGHSIGCAVAIEALKVIQEEGLVENSYHLGKYFRESLTSLRSPYIKELRGRGLMNALEIHKESKIAAWDICLKLRDNGLLCKPTHENIIRLTPPLVITKSEIDQSIEIINKVFKSL